MKLLSAFVGLSFLVVSPGYAGEKGDHPKSPEKMAIKEAVFDYFDGQSQRDQAQLERAFAGDHAQMIGVLKADDGSDKLNTWQMRDVIPNWADGDPMTEERVGEITSIQIVDNRIATVMFDSNGRFYDALTLAKVNGEWKIIAKAFVLQSSD